MNFSKGWDQPKDLQSEAEPDALELQDFGSTSRWDPALALTKLCFLSRPIPYIVVLYSDGFGRTSEKSQMFNLRGVDGAALIFGNW